MVLNEIHFHPKHTEENPFLEGSENEFLELHNLNDTPVDVSRWRLNDGVDFTFPESTVIPGLGFAVVAANPTVFLESHPDFNTNQSLLLGPWSGKLSNSGERVRLVDSAGELVDEVRYADDGDWSFRLRGSLDYEHEGWIWSDATDGGGFSLELIQPELDNGLAQAWGTSLQAGGSPGEANSIRLSNIPPILHSLQQSPILPTASDFTTVWVGVADEFFESVQVQLLYRADGAADFVTLDMELYDGINEQLDSLAVLKAVIPPQPAGSVVEFYFVATDLAGAVRYWPGSANVFDPAVQSANFLYQVEPEISPDHNERDPIYRIIMTERERQELAALGRHWRESESDARMNATFISSDGSGIEIRYRVGVRNRGHGSRDILPNNYRIHFRNDDPWHGVADLNINGQSPLLQYLGSVFTRSIGLPTAQSQLVRTWINGSNLAPNQSPQFGYYVANEVLDGEYLDRRFESDSDGNLYRARRIQQPGADLSFRGEAPDLYRKNYFKLTNSSEDDWSDLVELSRAMDAASEEDYVASVETWVDLENWFRYFAVDAFFDNTETNLGSGNADDYAMYSGVVDQRFRLIPYDLDSIWGMATTDAPSGFNLFRAGRIPTINRFLKHPAFARGYLRTVRQIYDDWFDGNVAIEHFIHNTLRNYAPVEYRQSLISFAKRRADFLISTVPQKLSYLILNNTTRHSDSDPWLVSEPVLQIWGQSDVTRTQSVRVQGELVDYSAWQGSWANYNVMIPFGDSQVHVAAFDEADVLIEEIWIPIRRLLESPRSNTGTEIANNTLVNEDTQWTLAGSPYWVGDLQIAADATLSIEPAVNVYFDPGAKIIVTGRLIAEGTTEHRIQFTLAPDATEGSRWNGMEWRDATGLSHLQFVDFSESDGAGISCEITRSEVVMENARWLNTRRKAVELTDASARFSFCEFPNVENDETVHGVGMPVDGYLIFNNNVFGYASGYSDVIDFTGGKRPGPILQVWHNTFMGGADDGLDLDGTDAHIEGNLFQNFIKNNSSASSANAIATDLESNIVAANNVFYNNDHDVLLKNGAYLISHNNTFVGSLQSAIAFDEPNRNVDPGRGAEIINCRFHIMSSPFSGVNPLDLESGALELDVNFTLWEQASLQDSVAAAAFPASLNWVGSQDRFGFNIDSFNAIHLSDLDPTPAKNTGLGKLDRGAMPTGVLSISPWPDEFTSASSAAFEFHAYGPGILEISYSLNGGDWSDRQSVNDLVRLENLIPGLQRLELRGWDSAGDRSYRGTIEQTISWTVKSEDPLDPTLRLTEVLAFQNNSPVVPLGTLAPDWIEIHNPGATPVDLTGIGITDRESEPFRFQFPDGMKLEPGAYLAIPSARPSEDSGLALGFGLNRGGESLRLNQQTPGGLVELDQVQFGLQPENLSISRSSDSRWTLTKPSIGHPNHDLSEPLSSPSHLRINEILALPDTDSINNTSEPFIEIINLGNFPVDLSQVRIGLVDRDFPAAHEFPNLSFIAPGETIALRASGAGISEIDTDELNFKLPKRQGHVGLWDRFAELVDQIIYTSPAPGQSYGRGPRAPDRNSITWNTSPSPGAINSSDFHNPMTIELDIVLPEKAWEMMLISSSRTPSPDWTFPSSTQPQNLQEGILVGRGPIEIQENKIPNLPIPVEINSSQTLRMRTPIGLPTSLANPDPDELQPSQPSLILKTDPRSPWIKYWWNGIPLQAGHPVDSAAPDTETAQRFLLDGSEIREQNWLAVEYPRQANATFTLSPTLTLSYEIIPETAADLATRDTDEDGMVDLWEIENQYDPEDPTDSLMDLDGDGLLTLEEHQAGTNPDNSNDNLHLAIHQTNWQGENLTVEIPKTVFGKVYQLEKATDISVSDIQYEVVTRQFGNGKAIQWIIPSLDEFNGTQPRAYYRVLLETDPAWVR